MSKKALCALILLTACQAPCAADAPPLIVGSTTVTVTSTTATIEWVTNEPATTHVDYGRSTVYGSTYLSEELITEHSAYLTGLTPWASYQYRVRSVDECGYEVVSENDAFLTELEDAISPPEVADEPDVVGPGPYEVVLEWSGVTAPSGSARYLVEVGDETFGSVDHSSGWIDETSWSASVGVGFHFWHVRARDAGDPSLVSEWSAADSFSVSTSNPPPAPVLVDEPNFVSGGVSTPVMLEWGAVTDPDGDPVQYYGQMGYSADFGVPSFESGWIDVVSWTTTIPPGGMWYWRVRARDADHVDAMSEWSEVDTFYDMTMPGSCPFLFGWDGHEYRYLTDIQGPAIGLPASVLTIQNMKHYRPEYVVMDGLEADSGKYRIKIRETQTEITYLDEIELIVVDCPEAHGVVSSTAESTYSYGYSDPFEIITVYEEMHAPVAAVDASGRSVLDALVEVDGEIVGGDERYVVDFGSVEDASHARLVIDGWSVYDRHAYPSKVLVQPFIEVRQGGRWVKARSFGNPAGDMKRMAVDISGLIGGKDHRIRINMGRVHAIRWFIDRIALDTSEPVSCEVRSVGASQAFLYHAGRVAYSRANGVHPNIARDDNLTDNVLAHSWGSYTRYGSVLELLDAADDMYAILRHGDEALVSFPEVEPAGEGMVRSLVLKAHLWYKHLSLSDSVYPLPFIGMQTYPGEGYPADEAHAAYLEKYNRRTYSK